MLYSLLYNYLWVSQNLFFYIFFLLTQYEVYSKFEYNNMWGVSSQGEVEIVRIDFTAV
jgi:hypothetical protein